MEMLLMQWCSKRVAEKMPEVAPAAAATAAAAAAAAAAAVGAAFIRDRVDALFGASGGLVAAASHQLAASLPA